MHLVLEVFMDNQNLDNLEQMLASCTSEKTYTEEECILIQAKETDLFVGLLIKRLKELDLLDDIIDMQRYK